MNPPPPPDTDQDVGGFVKFLQYLFIAAMVVTPITFVTWIIDSRESEVTSSQSIGRFISMSGPGGIPRGVVIETDMGSYPLIGTPVISKGTPLVLEHRLSDKRYVCDVPRSLCVPTTAEQFKSLLPAPTPD